MRLKPLRKLKARERKGVNEKKGSEKGHALILGFSAAMIHPGVIVTGSNLRSTFPTIKGWCSPKLPTNVYDLSNPVGRRIFISQLFFAKNQKIDNSRSSGLSLTACPTNTQTSAQPRDHLARVSSQKTQEVCLAKLPVST